MYKPKNKYPVKAPKEIGKNQRLEPTHHVMRYVPYNRLFKDDDGNVTGFTAQAFSLRDNEDTLSLNWLEYFDGDFQQQVEGSIKAFRAFMDVAKKSAFGIASVQSILDTYSKYGHQVRVVYFPEEDNQSHSEIRNAPRGELNVLEALATEAFKSLILNSSVAP
jgi:hypothetical protein